MRIVVTGGAGFLGSHLCDALHDRGDEVVCVDDLSSGRLDNVRHLLGSSRFDFRQHDIRDSLQIDGAVDVVVNMASLASPPRYLERPLFTLSTGSVGTQNALELAAQHGARFVQASTSEVYGDPLVHPQREDYWGNVNPHGPRSVYDEAKRYAEAITAAYRRDGVNTGIIRIFNTYGPRMSLDDGRVVTNFIKQAMDGQPLTVYGDGTQTRSLCFVSDLIDGWVSMIDSSFAGPVNLGNPQELTILEIAELIRDLMGVDLPIEHRPLPQDDPLRRQPDISLAKRELGWEPKVNVVDGLRRTVDWYTTTVTRELAYAGG